MEVTSGGVVISLAPDEAVALGRQLAEAIRLAYVARDRTPPRALLDLADQVNRTARGTAEDRGKAQVRPHAGPGRVQAGSFPAAFEQPVITVNALEAARIAQVSTGYVRKLIRRGDIEATRTRRGWSVSVDSLAAWVTRRRTESEHRRAA